MEKRENLIHASLLFGGFAAVLLFGWPVFHAEVSPMVPVDSMPSRIVSVPRCTTNILTMIGGCDKIVGVADIPDLPPCTASAARVGRGFGNLNIEAISALEPDLVFAWEGSDSDLLRIHGFKVASVRSGGLENVMNLVEIVSSLAGKPGKGIELARKMADTIQRIRERHLSKPGLRVYFEWSAAGHTVGPGSLTHELITTAGGRNIASGIGMAYPIVSPEFVAAMDPEVILVSQRGASFEDLASRPGFDRVSAIRNGNVFEVPAEYTNYTPSCIDGLAYFSEIFERVSKILDKRRDAGGRQG